MPFIEWLRGAYPDQLISVDTWRAAVAKQACAAGADLINDTWGGHDPGLPEVAAEFGAGLVCSHTGGAVPRTRPFRVNYGISERGVVDDVIAEVTAAAERAVAAGVARDAVLIDPTHDFGKNTYHGLTLLRHVKDLVNYWMAGPDGAEQQGFRRGNSGCGSDRTPGGHPRGDRPRRRGRRRDVPCARGRPHTTRTGDGRVDPGRASADAHGEGTGMTLTPELPGTDVVTGRWLTDHSWNRPTWTIAELEAAKGGRTISVVLPALNEEETVGSVVETITPLLGGLVDELIVLDSGSTDDTEIRAIAAGARVISREVALPEVEPQPGKGEVLWRSLAATTGDIVVFVDSDLIDPDPMFVPKLLGPLLTTDGVHLVKGFYRRPLKVSGSEDANGGGRVTELVARPLLASLRPELTCVLQPLGGEYAGTRELLTSVPFAPGYGVEIGLLVDTYDRLGLDAIAQVNLGVRTHRNRPLTELASMSRQVIATLLSQCGVPDSGVGLTQFFADGDDYTPRTSTVSLVDRPPMITLRPRG